MSFVNAGDFAFYDHLLNLSVALGVIPPRFGADARANDLDTCFRMARGRAPSCQPTKCYLPVLSMAAMSSAVTCWHCETR